MYMFQYVFHMDIFIHVILLYIVYIYIYPVESVFPPNGKIVYIYMFIGGDGF